MAINRYRELAVRLVDWMDKNDLILQDSHDDEGITQPIPQGLLREFRKLVESDPRNEKGTGDDT